MSSIFIFWEVIVYFRDYKFTTSMVDWHVLFTAFVFFFEFLNMWNLYNLFVFVDLGWPFPLNQLLGESTLSPWYGLKILGQFVNKVYIFSL